MNRNGYQSTQSGRSNSIFPWPGGKGENADWIIDKIPPHDTFVEVFGGSAAITYNKPPSKYEIYNDLNDDLVQFFEVLRSRESELIEWLQAVPYSRSLYEKWVAKFYEGYRPDDPLERAGRFFTLRYMQSQGESSKANGFKTRSKRSPARSFDNAREQLWEVADRFRQVTIENKDYRDLLEDYDDNDVDVIFYADPPYVDTEHFYGEGFGHTEFIEALDELDAEWMVSYEDLPDGIAEIGCVLERSRRHRMKQDDADVTEHLVCSFDPKSHPSFVSQDVQQQTLGGM